MGPKVLLYHTALMPESRGYFMIYSSAIRKAFCLVLLTGAAAMAHHQFSSEYDKSKPLTLTATVKSVDWKSPHVQWTVSAKNQAGAIEDWTLEGAAPDYLTSHGVTKATFADGSMVTVNAYRATNNSRTASVRVITDAKGKAIQVCDPTEDGGPAK